MSYSWTALVASVPLKLPTMSSTAAKRMEIFLRRWVTAAQTRPEGGGGVVIATMDIVMDIVVLILNQIVVLIAIVLIAIAMPTSYTH